MAALLRKIFVVWLLLVGAAAMLAVTVDRFPDSMLTAVARAVYVLCGITALVIVRQEATAWTKIFFFLLSAHFMSMGVLYFPADVMDGSFFQSDSRFLNLYITQYAAVASTFCLLVTIIYLSVTSLLGETKGWLRIYGAAVIALVLVWAVFQPMLVDKKFLYRSPDITDFRIIDRAVGQLKVLGEEDPNAEMVAGMISLSNWDGRNRIGELSKEQTIVRVKELLPYLDGKNYMLLILGPLWMRVALAWLLCLVITILLLAHRYINDPPESPFISRLVLGIGLYCLFEVLHLWIMAALTEHENLIEILQIGRIPTIAVLVAIELILLARLKYIVSIDGKYFEKNIALHPSRVTRWRDSLDIFVLKHFFNRKNLPRGHQ